MDTPYTIGPFEVRRELGRGAAGVVYEALDRARDRALAVKLYGPAARDALERLRGDARILASLEHPNLAAVLGVGEEGEQTWVATELVLGLSLAQVARSRSPWPVERVLDVWRQLCEGLAHAHRAGVLHLDLKPADVRITRAGEVKLVDFGCRHLKSLEGRGAGPLEDGLRYRAPEWLAGLQPDGRVDTFAVAAIVYELVVQSPAFPGTTVAELVRNLSRCEPDLSRVPSTPFSQGFESILARGLARQPEERYASPEDMHADLVRLVRDTAPRLREEAAPAQPALPPPSPPPAQPSVTTPASAATKAPIPSRREELAVSLTRARAAGRLEEALDVCEKLLDLDPADTVTRQVVAEIESVLLERRLDDLVGTALAHAADGELDAASAIVEKIERLAPWSPRYLQLQVYVDEERARRTAEALVAAGRGHLAEGRAAAARTAAREALAAMPGHAPALQLLDAAGPESPGAEGGAAQPAAEGALQSPSADEEAKPQTAASEPGRPSAPLTAAIASQAVVSDRRIAEAEAESAAALQHFLANEHALARKALDRALALDPGNRRARELLKILHVLG